MTAGTDELARWKRRRWIASIATGVGLLVQAIGFEAAGYGGNGPLGALLAVGTLAAAVVACYYWYQLKSQPVHV
jgi:hypothetical protein